MKTFLYRQNPVDEGVFDLRVDLRIRNILGGCHIYDVKRNWNDNDATHQTAFLNVLDVRLSQFINFTTVCAVSGVILKLKIVQIHRSATVG